MANRMMQKETKNTQKDLSEREKKKTLSKETTAKKRISEKLKPAHAEPVLWAAAMCVYSFLTTTNNSYKI